ncbi:MAG: hypothetical protein ACR2JH_01595 [Solirubrobacteraceae bacterium]
MATVLARAYRCSAFGYVALFVGVLVVVFLSYTGASVWIFARYFKLADLRMFLLAGESGVLVGMIISAAVTARKEVGLTEWLGGGVTGDRAVEAWDALAGLPGRLIRRSMLIVGGITAPLLTLASVRAQLDVAVIGLLLAGMVALNFGCGSFALTLLDIFLRPIRAKIDSGLPRDFQPSYLSVGMNRRLTGELSLLILAPAFLTAGLLAPTGGGSAAFIKSFLVSGVVAGAFSALIGQALIERVTGPPLCQRPARRSPSRNQ